jgi:hypothetical protein
MVKKTIYAILQFLITVFIFTSCAPKDNNISINIAELGITNFSECAEYAISIIKINNYIVSQDTAYVISKSKERFVHQINTDWTDATANIECYNSVKQLTGFVEIELKNNGNAILKSFKKNLFWDCSSLDNSNWQ